MPLPAALPPLRPASGLRPGSAVAPPPCCAQVAALTAYELQYTGHEGYKKAEVTGGGVPLEEINCATMESRVRDRVALGLRVNEWPSEG